MTYDPLATPFLVQSITLERRTASDAYSGDTFAAPLTVRGWWHDVQRLVRADDGREVVSTSHVSVQADVSVGDRVIDPQGVAREVIAVTTNRALNGRLSHRVAYLAGGSG